jgi:hypothetical protein
MSFKSRTSTYNALYTNNIHSFAYEDAKTRHSIWWLLFTLDRLELM